MIAVHVRSTHVLVYSKSLLIEPLLRGREGPRSLTKKPIEKPDREHDLVMMLKRLRRLVTSQVVMAPGQVPIYERQASRTRLGLLLQMGSLGQQ
jgi:hypothetical protein